MQETQNTKVVQDAYAAFGRGDVQGILDRLDDGIVWKGVYGAGPHVPTSGERRGKAQVGEFFKQVAQTVNFSRFEPKEFIATGDKVVALGHYTATTTIGKKFDSDFAMVFTVRNGRVIEFQEFTDSAAVNAAYQVDASV
ncbi:MAG TPA: nuclear transport factor 2 family protein [Vicinamibacterales bacterium]|nr:nuclear transport factor 2 family protein [Vicinamibacterales bacterium]